MTRYLAHYKQMTFLNLYNYKINKEINSLNRHEILEGPWLSADVYLPCLCHSKKSFADIIKVLSPFPFHRWVNHPHTRRGYTGAMSWFLLDPAVCN